MYLVFILTPGVTVFSPIAWDPHSHIQLTSLKRISAQELQEKGEGPLLQGVGVTVPDHQVPRIQQGLCVNKYFSGWKGY